MTNLIQCFAPFRDFSNSKLFHLSLFTYVWYCPSDINFLNKNDLGNSFSWGIHLHTKGIVAAGLNKCIRWKSMHKATKQPPRDSKVIWIMCSLSFKNTSDNKKKPFFCWMDFPLVLSENCDVPFLNVVCSIFDFPKLDKHRPQQFQFFGPYSKHGSI